MGIVCRSDEELQELLSRARAGGKKIVTTNGCFDIINLAHIRMLQEASRQGDILVVGVNSDRSVRAWKGDSRPIRKEEERAGIVAAIAGVDYAVLFDERDSDRFVARVRPDIHVNDRSYGEDCVEAAALRTCGGRLHLIDKLEWESNSDLVERIRKLT